MNFRHTFLFLKGITAQLECTLLNLIIYKDDELISHAWKIPAPVPPHTRRDYRHEAEAVNGRFNHFSSGNHCLDQGEQVDTQCHWGSACTPHFSSAPRVAFFGPLIGKDTASYLQTGNIASLLKKIQDAIRRSSGAHYKLRNFHRWRISRRYPVFSSCR